LHACAAELIERGLGGAQHLDSQLQREQQQVPTLKRLDGS
jgi:hypothetical protein